MRAPHARKGRPRARPVAPRSLALAGAASRRGVAAVVARSVGQRFQVQRQPRPVDGRCNTASPLFVIVASALRPSSPLSDRARRKRAGPIATVGRLRVSSVSLSTSQRTVGVRIAEQRAIACTGISGRSRRATSAGSAIDHAWRRPSSSAPGPGLARCGLRAIAASGSVAGPRGAGEQKCQVVEPISRPVLFVLKTAQGHVEKLPRGVEGTQRSGWCRHGCGGAHSHVEFRRR